MGEAVKLPTKPVRFKWLRYATACLCIGFSNVFHLLGAVSSGLAKLCESVANDLEDYR